MNRQDGDSFESITVCSTCVDGETALNEGYLSGMFDPMQASPPDVSSVHEIAPDVCVAVLRGHALTSMTRNARGRLKAIYTHSTGDLYMGGSGDVLCGVRHDAARKMCLIVRSPVYFDSIVNEVFPVHPKRGLQVFKYYYDGGESNGGATTIGDNVRIDMDATISRLEKLSSTQVIAFGNTKFYLITIPMNMDRQENRPTVKSFALYSPSKERAIIGNGKHVFFGGADNGLEIWSAVSPQDFVDYRFAKRVPFVEEARSLCNWGAPGVDRLACISRGKVYVSRHGNPLDDTFSVENLDVAFDYETAEPNNNLRVDDHSHLERLVPLHGAIAVLVYKLGARSIDILRESAPHVWTRRRIAFWLTVIDDVTCLSNGNMLFAADERVMEFIATSDYTNRRISYAKQV